MKPDTEKALINIMDCIAGADGGISFINLRGMIEEMDNRDEEGAKQIVEVVKRFSRLIDVANNKDDNGN